MPGYGVAAMAALHARDFRHALTALSHYKRWPAPSRWRSKSRMLEWTPRDPREAIIAAAESMVRKGLIVD